MYDIRKIKNKTLTKNLWYKFCSNYFREPQQHVKNDFAKR